MGREEGVLSLCPASRRANTSACRCAQGSGVRAGTGTGVGGVALRKGGSVGAHRPQHPGESSRPRQATTQTKVQPNSSFISDAGLFPYHTACAPVFPRVSRECLGASGQYCVAFTLG